MSSGSPPAPEGAAPPVALERLVFGPSFADNLASLSVWLTSQSDLTRLKCTPGQLITMLCSNGSPQVLDISSTSGKPFFRYREGTYPISVFLLFKYFVCFTRRENPNWMSGNSVEDEIVLTSDLVADLRTFFAEHWPSGAVEGHAWFPRACVLILDGPGQLQFKLTRLGAIVPP